MPQQYSNRRPHREGRTAESGPAGLDEGQRRSGGGDAHGTLPVPQEAKGGSMGLEFGWHHEAESLSSQSRGTGAFYHFATAAHPGQQPASHKKEF